MSRWEKWVIDHTWLGIFEDDEGKSSWTTGHWVQFQLDFLQGPEFAEVFFQVLLFGFPAQATDK